MSVNLVLHVLGNVLGTAIYSYGLKKRRFFWLKLVLVLSAYLIYSFLLVAFLWKAMGEAWNYVGYIFNVGIMCAGVLICFDTKIITAIFCITCGYCIQHIAQRSHNLIVYVLLGLARNTVIDALFATAIMLAVLALCLFTYKKFVLKKEKEPNIRNAWQIVLTGCTFLVLIYIEEWTHMDVIGGSRTLWIGSYLMYIIFAVIVLILEYNLVAVKYAMDENDTLKQIMEIERRQYETEKSVMDVINIKCHDLKHQLMREGGKLSADEIESTKNAISLYDSFYKTGNATLDTVLTMKGLVCENKKINLTCNVDGESLSFMADSDIYSLFGNLLDNCIEAVDQLPEDKRFIVVIVEEKERFLFIKTENEFEGQKVLKDGLPHTTKSDTLFHGFGLRSINNISQKYNGNMTIDTEDNIFKLSIMICL